MRSLLILAMTITPLFLNNVCLADDNEIEECRTNCRANEDSRDMDCPSPDDSPGQERPQCLQDSLQVYFHCLKDCHPHSSSAQAPANPEPAPAPMPDSY